MHTRTENGRPYALKKAPARIEKSGAAHLIWPANKVLKTQNCQFATQI
jgi:hypothetical protein